MKSEYWSVHSHSAASLMDGMNSVSGMVDRVVELGQPALALTDHGTLAGSVQLYQACKKTGIAPFIGSEMYVVRDVSDPQTKGERWHLGLLALDFVGYQALAKLQTLSYQKDRFYRKPLIDLSDLAFLADQGYAKHLAVTTGCYSGMVVNGWKGLEPDVHSRNMILMLAQWFPNLYVELQNHGIVWPEGHNDLVVAGALFEIAQHAGLPVVVGGDSHYVLPSEQPVHDLMKSICYGGNDEDSKFSGGPYHLLSAVEALGGFPAYMHDAIEDGHSDLLDKHRLTIPALEQYHFHVPVMHKKPDEVLSDMARKMMVAKGLQTLPYISRLETELKVVAAMGFANYFLLVKEHVSDWCRGNDVIINTRGSANGSLVCFVLGITTVNPIQWGTSFDRFLSLDRKKPPDIDVDVDFHGRARLVEHLRAVWPTMTQVGTYANIGYGKPDEFGEETGSVIVQYMAAMSRKDPDFDGKVKKEHWAALNALADTKVYKSMGTNAAGFILPGEGLRIDDYLPLGRIVSSDTTLTQYSKDDVEALGYMKIDILGLRALQTLNGTLTRIGRKPNDWDWIPYDDVEACKWLRSGNGTGLFQYEGFSTARGGKELGVRSTLDAILVLALYRPALMNGGQKDMYLANRGRARKYQFRLHPLFDPVVKDTAGVPLFQEQIMEILKTLGMKFAEWNDLMTAVKASSGYIQGAAQTFKRLMPVFYDLCEDKGVVGDEADDVWHAVVGFTEYGFGRAHATSYGLMSYYSAYLKAHYPLEYMTSVLDVWVGVTVKERLYTAECRRLGFSIVKADVNQSDVSWAVEKGRGNALRKGLASLPGIGEPTAQAIVSRRPVGGYADLDDFIKTSRVSGGKSWKKTGELNGVCRSLMEQGAFRSIHQ